MSTSSNRDAKQHETDFKNSFDVIHCFFVIGPTLSRTINIKNFFDPSSSFSITGSRKKVDVYDELISNGSNFRLDAYDKTCADTVYHLKAVLAYLVIVNFKSSYGYGVSDLDENDIILFCNTAKYLINAINAANCLKESKSICEILKAFLTAYVPDGISHKNKYIKVLQVVREKLRGALASLNISEREPRNISRLKDSVKDFHREVAAIADASAKAQVAASHASHFGLLRLDVAAVSNGSLPSASVASQSCAHISEPSATVMAASSEIAYNLDALRMAGRLIKQQAEKEAEAIREQNRAFKAMIDLQRHPERKVEKKEVGDGKKQVVGRLQPKQRGADLLSLFSSNPSLSSHKKDVAKGVSSPSSGLVAIPALVTATNADTNLSDIIPSAPDSSALDSKVMAVVETSTEPNAPISVAAAAVLSDVSASVSSGSELSEAKAEGVPQDVLRDQDAANQTEVHRQYLLSLGINLAGDFKLPAPLPERSTFIECRDYLRTLGVKPENIEGVDSAIFQADAKDSENPELLNILQTIIKSIITSIKIVQGSVQRNPNLFFQPAPVAENTIAQSLVSIAPALSSSAAASQDAKASEKPKRAVVMM